LLDRFGSVEAIVTAPESELAKADGIGKVTAQRIRAIVREARAWYGTPSA
jgi:ERCC4-type nuclease